VGTNVSIKVQNVKMVSIKRLRTCRHIKILKIQSISIYPLAKEKAKKYSKTLESFGNENNWNLKMLKFQIFGKPDNFNLQKKNAKEIKPIAWTIKL